MLASLLSIQSLKLFPNADSFSFLIDNKFAFPITSRMNHDSWVSSVAFNPDGKYVVSGSLDYTVRVWEATTGNEVARMTHDGDVSSVAFSPDGKYIVTGSDYRTARIWEWKAEDLIANACVNMPRNLTREEWRQYIGDVLPYQAVCENLPIEADATAIP